MQLEENLDNEGIEYQETKQNIQHQETEVEEYLECKLLYEEGMWC